MMLSQKRRPHIKVKVILLMKLIHSLIVAKDINKSVCIIILCYFVVNNYLYYYYACNVFANCHVDFKVILYMMHFHCLILLINK